MNTIISRMLVLGLLFSFVHAQEPSRDINKDEAKNARSEQKGKSAKKDKANRTDMPDGVSSDYEQKHTNVKNVTGAEKGGSATTGKLGPGGNSARMGSGDTAVGKKSGKQAKKGFLGRLFGRSSKKESSTGSVAGVGGSPRPGSKSGGQTGGKQPSAGGDKQQQPKGPAGEKPGQGQGDDGP